MRQAVYRMSENRIERDYPRTRGRKVTEGGHSVAETLNSAGGRRANGLAQLLDVPACIGWEGRKVGSHLQAVLLSAMLQRRRRFHRKSPTLRRHSGTPLKIHKYSADRCSDPPAQVVQL